MLAGVPLRSEKKAVWILAAPGPGAGKGRVPHSLQVGGVAGADPFGEGFDRMAMQGDHKDISYGGLG